MQSSCTASYCLQWISYRKKISLCSIPKVLDLGQSRRSCYSMLGFFCFEFLVSRWNNKTCNERKVLYFVVVSVKKALFRRVSFISFAHVVLVFCFSPLKGIRLSARKLGFKNKFNEASVSGLQLRLIFWRVNGARSSRGKTVGHYKNRGALEWRDFFALFLLKLV